MTELDRNNGHRSGVSILRGAHLGMLTAAVCACVDVVFVAAVGKRIPWTYAPYLIAAYLILGGLGGTALVVVQSLLRSRWPINAPPVAWDTSIRRGCLLGWATVLVVPLVERLQRPFSPDFGASISPGSVGLLVVGFAAAALLTRWPIARSTTDRMHLWGAACLAVGAISWHSLSKLYTADVVSVKSFAANAFFVGMAVVVYSLGRRPAAAPLAALRITTASRCLLATALLATMGIGIASALRHLVERSPIDQRHAFQVGQPADERSDHPDVILIVMDTVRADHISAYGYHRPTTPNLETFAREAVRFERAVAPSSWTLPSHATLFTGLLPTEHGAHYDEFGRGAEAYEARPLSQRWTTLAELLAGEGYYTGAVVGNSGVVSREFGFEQGFAYFDDRDRVALDTAVPNTPVPSLWAHQAYLAWVGQDGYHYRYADQVNRSVVRWLSDAPDDPLFLFVNYMDPHQPYRRHAQFDDRLGLTPMPPIRRCPVNTPGAEDVARQLAPYNLDNYDSEIAFTDAQIGELFDELKRLDRYDDSLIIVTSDHGEAFGEHGYHGHPTSLYEEEIHVPLLVRYPGGDDRRVEATPVSLAQVMPLVLEHLQIDSSGLRLPARRGASEVISEVRFRPEDQDGGVGGTILRSVTRSDHLKIINSSDTSPEIYDLTRDPGEQDNLQGSQADLIAWATAYVATWVSDARFVHQSINHEETVSQNAIARLRELGYLD